MNLTQLSPLHRGIVNTVAQAGAVATARIDQYVQPRLQIRVERLSQVARLEALAKVLNTSLDVFWRFVWERTDDGQYLGWDQQTRGILTPVPWSWRQCGDYGLRRGQSHMLGIFMRAWAANVEPLKPIVWDGYARRWCVSVDAGYPTYKSGATIMANAVTVNDLAIIEAAETERRRGKSSSAGGAG